MQLDAFAQLGIERTREKRSARDIAHWHKKKFILVVQSSIVFNNWLVFSLRYRTDLVVGKLWLNEKNLKECLLNFYDFEQQLIRWTYRCTNAAACALDAEPEERSGKDIARSPFISLARKRSQQPVSWITSRGRFVPHGVISLFRMWDASGTQWLTWLILYLQSYFWVC